MIDKQGLEQWAASHETDEDLAEAIFYLAGDDDIVERIWQDPTNAEIVAIWERATENGLHSDDLSWGDSNLRQIMERFE